jgi:hypothetical protein
MAHSRSAPHKLGRRLALPRAWKELAALTPSRRSPENGQDCSTMFFLRIYATRKTFDEGQEHEYVMRRARSADARATSHAPYAIGETAIRAIISRDELWSGSPDRPFQSGNADSSEICGRVDTCPNSRLSSCRRRFTRLSDACIRPRGGLPPRNLVTRPASASAGRMTDRARPRARARGRFSGADPIRTASRRSHEAFMRPAYVSIHETAGGQRDSRNQCPTLLGR